MNNINLTRDELNKLVKENNLEVYPQEQFNAYIEGNKELLIKGETSDLDEIEKSEYNVLQEEIKSFKKVEVYNIVENSKSIIEKSICYVRPKQVEWTEEDVLVKSEDGPEQIEKAKSGIYTNSRLNRKLGRVGQKYGESNVFEQNKKKANSSSVSKWLDQFDKPKESTNKKEEDLYMQRQREKLKSINENTSTRDVRHILFDFYNQDQKIKVTGVRGSYNTTVSDERHELFKESMQDEPAGIKRIEII